MMASNTENDTTDQQSGFHSLTEDEDRVTEGTNDPNNPTRDPRQPNGLGSSVDRPHPLVILLKVARHGGRPLPRTLYQKSTIVEICKTVAGVEPLEVEVMNDYECVIECTDSSSPTAIARAIQEMSTWHDIEVEVRTLVTSPSQISDIVTHREDMRRQEMELEKRHRELLAREHKNHAFALQNIKEQDDVMRKMFDQMEIQSKIVADLVHKVSELSAANSKPPSVSGKDFATPGTSAEKVSKVAASEDTNTPDEVLTRARGSAVVLEKTPRLGSFSGEDPLPKNEITFPDWAMDVQAALHNHPEPVVRQVAFESVKGAAKNLIRYLGPAATTHDYLEKLEVQYGGVATADTLMQQFYHLSQDKGETVACFAARVEGALNRLMVRYPQLIPPKDKDRQLLERVFNGMHVDNQNGVRYLYNEPGVTYKEFLLEARRTDKKAVAVRAKAASVDIEPSQTQTEIGILRDEVAMLSENLITNVKAAMASAKPAATGANQNNNNAAGGAATTPQTATGANNRPREGNRNRYFGRNGRGPETNHSGPFPQGIPPLVCYNCKGIGHKSNVCPTPSTRGNGTRGENERENLPPAQNNQNSSQEEGNVPRNNQNPQNTQ